MNLFMKKTVTNVEKKKKTYDYKEEELPWLLRW